MNIRPKKFVRSYYQIRHHIYESKYIPNYDEYTIDDMREVLNKYFGFKEKILIEMEHGKIRYLFLKRISKQVRDLETDIQVFS